MTIDQNESPDIHTWFGLSYSNYLVLHRTLLQSMPEEWQRRFTAMLGDLWEAFDHVEQPQCFKVEPATEREIGDLSDDELARIGYSRDDEDCDCALVEGESPPVCTHEVRYYDDRSNEVESWQRVAWPVSADPVPHYNRGRTYIEPRLKAG